MHDLMATSSETGTSNDKKGDDLKQSLLVKNQKQYFLTDKPHGNWNIFSE